MVLFAVDPGAWSSLVHVRCCVCICPEGKWPAADSRAPETCLTCIAITRVCVRVCQGLPMKAGRLLHNV